LLSFPVSDTKYSWPVETAEAEAIGEEAATGVFVWANAATEVRSNTERKARQRWVGFMGSWNGVMVFLKKRGNLVI
jgi:hypothetical protein